MLELEVINQQIELLHAKSSSGIPLDFTEVKMLESLVRSKVLITAGNTATFEENPFADMSTETLKGYLENLNKETAGDQEPN